MSETAFEAEEILEEGSVFELGTVTPRPPLNPEIAKIINERASSAPPTPVPDGRDYLEKLIVSKPDPPSQAVGMVLEQATRWNSKFLMLERYLVLHEFVQELFRSTELLDELRDLQEVTSNEYRDLLWVWRMLYPAYVMTLHAQKASCFYATMLKNVNHFRNSLSLCISQELSPYLQSVRLSIV